MKVGVVVIGRNEGRRLVTCLESVSDYPTVYVDSGSTDHSVKNAQAVGADVVGLDMSVPFTAARGRNEGYRFLLSRYPDLEYVMFVDGDCEIVKGWVGTGVDFLDTHSDYGVVCGRRVERHPESSFYNKLCDIEWDTPIGDANACGGDAIYRRAVLEQTNGFDPTFIAGEEPELCFRIRSSGMKIMRIDAEMTLHDADMHEFRQWWKRSLRSGYAYALNNDKHGKASAERFKYRELKSIYVWVSVATVCFVLSLFSLNPVFILFYILVFSAQIFRIGLRNMHIKKRYGLQMSFAYAFSTMLAKFPQFMGMLKFWRKKRSGEKHTLVEYK